jgi:hypothetical protein
VGGETALAVLVEAVGDPTPWAFADALEFFADFFCPEDVGVAMLAAVTAGVRAAFFGSR